MFVSRLFDTRSVVAFSSALRAASVLTFLFGWLVGPTAAISPVILESSTPIADHGGIFTTIRDLDGDGRGDFVQSASNSLQVISSADGRVLRTYIGETDDDGSFGRAFEPLPDSDGDGFEEFLVSAPLMNVGPVEDAGVVYGVSSRTPSGPIGESSVLFRTEIYSPQLAVSGNIAAMGSVSLSQVMLVDGGTGEVRARLVDSIAPIGFGMAMSGIGDLNGNGVADFALANPNVIHSNPYRLGTVYIVDGTTTTTEWTEVSTLPPESLLATIVPSENAAPGRHTSIIDRELIADLGDPRPSNDVNERLLVCASPGLVRGGGFSAYLLTEEANGRFSSQMVSFYEVDITNARFGESVARLGDVNNDGVSDVAIADRTFNAQGSQVGRVLIIDGAGLLDGFSFADVVQEFQGTPERRVGSGVRFLGDYDGDGANELLLPSDDDSNVAYLADVYTLRNTLARTGFDEPPLDATAYEPPVGARELGFQTVSQPTSGVNPLAAVSVTVPATTPVLTHRSTNATTTFDAVDLRGWRNASIGVSIQVSDTGYETGDSLRVYVTDGVQTIDILSAIGRNGENNDPLEALGGQGFVEYELGIPDDWSSVTLVIRSSSNSSVGAERYDFDDIAVYATPVPIPEPSTLGLAVAAIVVGVLRQRFRKAR